MNISENIIDLYRASGSTIGTAESCTGGLVSSRLTDVPGSSDVFLGGLVTYSNAAKTNLLGVSEGTLARFGAVSEEVAVEMATGARIRLGADVAVSITGIAGPGGSENKPEGRVCFAIADTSGAESSTQEFGALGRPHVRQVATEFALRLLLARYQSA